MNAQDLQAEDLLTGIREGMNVYDVSADRIGSVKHIQLNDESDLVMQDVEDRHLREAPEPLRMRLLRSGYIQISTGLLTRNRYATPDQIRYVTRDGVYLDAFYGELTAL